MFILFEILTKTPRDKITEATISDPDEAFEFCCILQNSPRVQAFRMVNHSLKDFGWNNTESLTKLFQDDLLNKEDLSPKLKHISINQKIYPSDSEPQLY